MPTVVIDPCRLIGALSMISCSDVALRTFELRFALLAACDMLRLVLTRWISSLKFFRKTWRNESVNLTTINTSSSIAYVHFTKLLWSGRISIGTSLLCISKHLSIISTCRSNGISIIPKCSLLAFGYKVSSYLTIYCGA